MMMRLTTALALALASPVFADEATDAATAFIKSPVQQKLIGDMLSPQMLMTQFEAMGIQLTDEQTEVVLRIVREELVAIRPEMEDAMIVGAADAFTVEEIEALTAFYSTPEGASAMAKMNPYMQTTMNQMMPSLRSAQGRIMERVQAELQ